MKNLTTKKLSDLLIIKNGSDYKHLNAGNIPLLGSGGVMSYVDDKLYDKKSILLPRKGTLDNIMFMESHFWTVDTMYWSEINEEKVSPYYLYLYLSLLDLSPISSGSTLPSMTMGAYYSLDIQLPDRIYQDKISDFIYKIDSLIKNNNLLIETISNHMKLLYNYWFIQFDFPDENGKPYKSSGGKMVWNEKLKREIPEGWEVQSINEIVESINTGLNPRTHFKLGQGDNNYVTIKNIVNGGIDFLTCDKVNDEAIIRIQERSNLKKGDILFTSITPIGRTYYLNRDPHKWNINESVFSIRADKEIISDLYLFSVIGSEYFKKSLENRATGSIMGGIRIGDLRSINIVIPQKEIMEKYHKIILPLVEKIDVLSQENTELKKQRDFLLPLLMNGQVTIK